MARTIEAQTMCHDLRGSFGIISLSIHQNCSEMVVSIRQCRHLQSQSRSPILKQWQPTLEAWNLRACEVHDEEMGGRGLLIYCSGFRCSHSVAISGDR